MKNRIFSSVQTGFSYRAIVTLILSLIVSYNAWAQAPSIVTQPVNRSVCLNGNTTFPIQAANTTSYQWQENDGNGWVNIVNGGIYSGATTAVLTLTGVTAGMNGYQYQCIATGAVNPPATTTAATLTVNALTTLTLQPVASQTICSGGNAVLTTAATGTGIAYQWYRYNGATYDPVVNSAVYSGATTATLNKGEALIVKIEGLPQSSIYKHGINLVPMGNDLFWVGSSFEWEYNHAAPTNVFRSYVEQTLVNWLKLPYTILEHKAAIRPGSVERRPFVGLHPSVPSVGIFNGMGTKGCSLAPYFASQFVSFLTQGTFIHPEADIARFKTLLSA